MRWLGILVRTVFFYVGTVLWTGLIGWIFAMPPAIIEVLLALRSSQVAHTILHHGVVYCSLPWRLLADVRMDRAARVGEGEAVVICNHHSYIDIFLLFHIFPRIRMTARHSLFRIPFLGWAMFFLRHIPHRMDRPEEALDEAARWLGDRTFVGFFPEGTRAPDGEIGPFQRGAFVLAQRTTEQVQPVVVVGTGRVWGKKRFWVRTLGPVAMRVLPPVAVPASANRTELKQIISDTRQLMLTEYRKLEQETFGVSPTPPV